MKLTRWELINDISKAKEWLYKAEDAAVAALDCENFYPKKAPTRPRDRLSVYCYRQNPTYVV
jgi:hypothetical protein